MSPAPPGLGQTMLPTQPLTIQLSLTNTAQLPDGRVLPPSDGLWREIGMSQAYFEPSQTC